MDDSSPLWAPGSTPPPGLWSEPEPVDEPRREVDVAAGPWGGAGGVAQPPTDAHAAARPGHESNRGLQPRPAEGSSRHRRKPNRRAMLVLVMASAAGVAGAGVAALDPGGAAPIRHGTHHTALKTYTAVPVTTVPTIPPAAPQVAAYFGPRIMPPVPVGSGVPTNLTDPSVVATALVPSLPLYPAPGAPAPTTTIANPNYLGATVVLLVTGIKDGWVQAYVPIRPNESTAWIPMNDVAISSVPCHIGIGIGAHRLVLYCHNASVFEATVATGAPDSPTPTGSYFVAYMVKLTDPQDAYGPYALGTSAFSNTYFSFEGGPGQVGIHGTNQPWVIGGYASHGCVRLTNPDITALAQQVVPGTPVEIAS